MNIKNNFNKNIALYDQFAGIQKITAHDLIDLLPRRNFSNILELGAGTGILTEKLVGEFPQAQILAIDSAENMLKIAKSKINNHNIDFLATDIMSFGSNNKFDLIIANAVLHWLGDLNAFIVKYKKLLKFRGCMAFSIFGPRTFHELGHCLKQIGILEPITSEKFFHKEMLEKKFADFGITAEANEIQYNIDAKDLMSLLKGIKYTGTRGYGVETRKIWTQKLITELEKIYLDKFGGIKVTYQVFYLVLHKGIF